MASALSVLFISPPSGTSQAAEADRLKSYLAVGALASGLRDLGFMQRFAQRAAAAGNSISHRVELLHLDQKPASKTISDFLAERTASLHLQPDIIAMTAASTHVEEAEEFAAAAAAHFPQALRLIGGPHASVLPEDVLRYSNFQVACIGEGVETMAEIALRWRSAGENDFAHIAGLAYRDGRGNVHVNSARRPLFRLDEYPFPSNSLDLFWPHLDDPAKNAMFPVSVLAGFGCPHDCIFCAQNCIHVGSIRERSAESIFAEIKQLHAKGFRKFAFVQETFMNSLRRVRRFCELVKSSSFEIEWTVEARADQVNRGDLVGMRSAGLKFLQLGVESGDDDLLQAIGKGIRRDQIVRVTEWCRELCIHSASYMLVGLPGQGWQSILRSALLIWEHPPFNLLTRHVSVAITIPYPGTRIAREGTVRVVDWTRRNWPDRNPAVTTGDEGEFLGRSFTETDDMTADEIFEAWLYLDDFSHFRMHASYGQDCDEDSARSADYAWRLLYMIARRVVRDLILRAQAGCTPQLRTAALRDLSQADGQAERHFKDVAASVEHYPPAFLRFLSMARFENGFDIMRRLEIPNRVKWMKVCALAWLCSREVCGQIAFAAEWKVRGEALDHHLSGVPSGAMDRCLEDPSNGHPQDNGIQLLANGRLQIFGVEFRMNEQAGRLSTQGLFS